jgi:hypothetical protein
MLRSVKDLEDYAIGASDGIIGHVKDFYFDDKAWVIRYLVVNTGAWLVGRKVLISPISIGHPDWTEKILPVWITKEQVKKSPGIDTETPVSRQHETRYLEYFGYPFYWQGGGLWGAGNSPKLLMPGSAGAVATPPAVESKAKEADVRAEAARHRDKEPHLRSCSAVMSYHIHATDGAIGHVQGLLVDDESWAIQYVIVATSHWWAGHQVLIAPKWIREVSWSDATIFVNLTQQAVKDAPLYNLKAQLASEKELGVYDYYGHLGYWATEETRIRDALERDH